MIQEISLHTRHWLWNHEDGRGRQGDQDMLMKLSSGQLLWRMATSMVLSKQVTIKKKVEFCWSVIVFRDYFMRDTKPKPQIASHQSQEKTKKEIHNRTNTSSTINNSFYGLYFDRPYLLTDPSSYHKNSNFQQRTCRYAQQGIPYSLFLWKCRMFDTWSNYIFIAVTPKRWVLGLKIWSSQRYFNLSNCKLTRKKKIGTSMGFKPMASVQPLLCSNAMIICAVICVSYRI